MKSKSRIYVEVTASFDADGQLLPKLIVWEDGTEYNIDRVLDIRPAFSAKSGGQGDRYMVRLGNHYSYLFFERSAEIKGNRLGRWFVEARHA
jgi:hypothetical protein